MRTVRRNVIEIEIELQRVFWIEFKNGL
jgi:hypothetical protein